MSVVEIKKLPLQEKFQLLEALWEDLGDKISEIAISPDDKELLDLRLSRLESNAVKVHNWDDVKDRIGKR